ncbi:hypothetical protein ACFFQF_32955 [Haladaptatus pallidirubidus]
MQQQSDEFEYDIDAYAYTEIERFEPWRLDFDEPATNADAVFQKFVTNQVYLTFAQEALSTSLSRASLVNDFRTDFQMMRFVPLESLEEIVRLELDQIAAVTFNAEAASTYADAAIKMRPVVNDAWEAVREDVGDLSPEEQIEQYRQWWDDPENREWVKWSLLETLGQWYALIDDEETDPDFEFNTIDSEQLLDADWADGMQLRREYYNDVAESHRELRSSLHEEWKAPRRRAG